MINNALSSINLIPTTKHIEKRQKNEHWDYSRFISIASSLENNKSYAESIAGIQSSLADYRNEQMLSGMQSVSLACSFRLTLLVSEMLVEQDGSIDLEAIPYLIDYVRLESQGDLNKYPCLERICKVLEELRVPQSPLIAILKDVKAPQNQNALERCTLLINSTILKERSYVPTDRDALVVAIKHLLDDDRQIETNTCQAEYLQIALNKMRPEIITQDVAQIIMQGAFFRNYLNTPVALTFPSYIACDTITDEIQIDDQGNIQNDSEENKTIAFYNAPPIKAALLQMGIPCDNAQLNQDIIDKLFGTAEGLASTTAEKIIIAYAELWKELFPEENLGHLVNLGIYGFAALRNSPSQRALISALLNAGQFAPGHFPTKWVAKAIFKSFQSKVEDLQPNDSYAAIIQNWWSGGDVPGIIGNIFKEKLTLLTRVQYEQHQVWDHTGMYGLNILYKNDPDKPFTAADTGTRINNAEEYQNFVVEVIKATELAIMNSDQYSKKFKMLSELVFKKMDAYANTNEFVQDSINIFDSKLKNPQIDPIYTSQNLPWRSYLTNMARTNTDLYLNLKPDAQIYKHISDGTNVTDLMNWFFNDVVQIDTMEVYPEANPQMYNGTMLDKIFCHSFNLLTDHPSLIRIKEYMTSNDVPLSDALYELVEVQGMAVANTPILDVETIIDDLSALINNFAKSSGEVFKEIPTKQGDVESSFKLPYRDFEKKLNKTVATKMVENDSSGILSRLKWEIHNGITVYDLSQKVIEALNKHFNSDNNPYVNEAIEGFVTYVVIGKLDAQNYQNIAGNSIHMADTNWMSTLDGLWPQHEHFCFYFNPVTLNWSIAMIHNDNAHLMAMPLVNNLGAFKLNLKEVQNPGFDPFVN